MNGFFTYALPGTRPRHLRVRDCADPAATRELLADLLEVDVVWTRTA